MANKTIKLASVAASVFAALSMGANAATFTNDTSRSLSVEGTAKSAGANVGMRNSGAIEITAASKYANNDVVKFTLTNGTWASTSGFVLKTSRAGQSSAVTSTKLGGGASNEVSFRLTSVPSQAAPVYWLDTSDVNVVNVKSLASDAQVTLGYTVTSGFGQSIDSATKNTILFFGHKEFSGTDTNVNTAVSLPNGRLNFGTSSGNPILTSTGSIAVSKNAATLGTVGLDNNNDKVDITITGDMSGVAGIASGNNAFTISGSTATLSVGALAAEGSATVPVKFTVDGTTELTARTWDVGVVLNLSDEDDVTLLSSTNDFGAWTVSTVKAVVSSMSLNSTGFYSWLKVANESAIDATIKGTANYSVTKDGVMTANGEVKDLNLGTAKANSVVTVGEAAILTAIGQSAADGVVDVTLDLAIDANTDDVHVVAEKKASNGRVATPVYYSRTLK